MQFTSDPLLLYGMDRLAYPHSTDHTVLLITRRIYVHEKLKEVKKMDLEDIGFKRTKGNKPSFGDKVKQKLRAINKPVGQKNSNISSKIEREQERIKLEEQKNRLSNLKTKRLNLQTKRFKDTIGRAKQRTSNYFSSSNSIFGSNGYGEKRSKYKIKRGI